MKKNMRKKTTKKVKLRSNQIEHTKRVRNMLKSSLSYVDTSKPGRGKTHAALYIAQKAYKQKGWEVFIIAPNRTSLTNHDGWFRWCEEYGVPVAASITYSKLAGRSGKVNHKWLGLDGTNEFWATKKFGNLCKKGLFIIFDECHHGTRSTSLTHWAMSALVKCCKKHSKTCRVALLSHTPGDKIEHMVPLLRIMGCTTQTTKIKSVLEEVSKECLKYTSHKDIEQYWEFPKKGYEKRILLKLYENVIKLNLFSRMPSDKSNKWKITALNAFLDINDKDVKLLNKGVETLSRSVRYHNGQIAQAQWDMGGITIGLKKIERAKLPTIARYVQKESCINIQRKFVIAIGARCTEHQYILQKMLKMPISWSRLRILFIAWKEKENVWSKLYKDMFKHIIQYCRHGCPMILNGKTSEQKRNQIIKSFQEDNDNIRVLIMSPGVGSEAISLHDTYGNRPRDLLISPDHFHTRIVQTAGRIWRSGQASDARILMIYAKKGKKETSVLSCMMRKAAMSRIFTAKDKEVVYPGEYPCWIEGEEDIEGIRMGFDNDEESDDEDDNNNNK